MAKALNPEQLRTYFALMESVTLLQHAVERQPRADGGIRYGQFQLLARLAEAKQLTRTALADGVVYSRSGLTHQAKLLEQAGLITRTGCPDDQRATMVTITDAGLALIQRLMPGHIEVVRDLMFDAMSDEDLHALAEIMTRARDHMRAQPPRSATARRRRTAG
jgi:DNA-binding MarR family transcriptional regulator